MAGCLLWLKINSFHLWKEEFRHADTLTFKCEQWKINTVWQKVNGVILGKVKFQIFMLLLLPAGLRVPKGALSGINTIVAQGFGTAGQHSTPTDGIFAKQRAGVDCELVQNLFWLAMSLTSLPCTRKARLGGDLGCRSLPRSQPQRISQRFWMCKEWQAQIWALTPLLHPGCDGRWASGKSVEIHGIFSP